MKIADATLQLSSSHTQQRRLEIRETLRRLPSSPTEADPPSASSLVQISPAGQSAETEAIEESIRRAEEDPILKLIRSMIAMLTGKEVEIFDARELQDSAEQIDPLTSPSSGQTTPPPATQSTVELSYHAAYSESEKTSFSASGSVRTADGKALYFSLSFVMQRSYHQESDIQIRPGNAAATKDPLIVNFDGDAAQLSGKRFTFDLDSDGNLERINLLTRGNGFLALDRNADGRINDGSELFGAQSGNGFAELALLDADHNGWIDENDAAYDRLGVWIRDDEGHDRLTTLEQADIGAIALQNAKTPFESKNSENVLQGQVRASGIFLHEDGKAGTVQQIDLTI